MSRDAALVSAFIFLPLACSSDNGLTLKPFGALAAQARNANAEQKDAFNAAKDLGTLEAWEAFLNTYSKGFYADLARAYVRKLGAEPRRGKTPPAPTGSKTTPQLETVRAGPGPTPWRMRSFEMDEGTVRTVAAAVASDGIELLFHCDGKNRLAGVLRETKRDTYPKFNERMRQGLAVSRGGAATGTPALIAMSFSDGTAYSVSARMQEINGEVSLAQDAKGTGFRAAGNLVKDLMSRRTVSIDAPPFSATLQLKRSRKALCSVINKCGARVARCKKFAKSKKTYKKKRRKRKVNRANSPYHDNKGKLLDGYIYDKNGNVTQDNGGGE